MKSEADIIIIRGAPGVGKSTIGKLFLELGSEGAVVDIDNVRRMVSSERFVYKKNSDYIISVKASYSLIEAFLVLGCKPVIVVDVFSVEILKIFVDLCNAHKIVIVTLYASDSVLARRIARREYGYKDCNVAIRLNRRMNQLIQSSDILIDTTLLSPKQVFSEIVKQCTVG